MITEEHPTWACCMPRQLVPIAASLVVHLLLHTIPTVLTCVELYVVLMAQFIVVHDDDLDLSCLGEVRQQHARRILTHSFEPTCLRDRLGCCCTLFSML